MLSDDQEKALKSLLDWQKDKLKNQFITLGGFAGTGKTTLISLFRKELHSKDSSLKIAFCSYTGKASRVLLQKLKENECIFPNDNVSTIHSLIYSPLTNDDEEIIGWELSKKIVFDLIIVDEASMIDSKIWSDLLSFRIPILAVGDHGQLPPISGSFDLMKHPNIVLNQIHRQAADNPIIKLSIEARTKGKIEIGKYDKYVKKISRTDSDLGETLNDLFLSYDENTLVLCGFNNTRIRLNKHIRSLLNFESDNPEFNDRIICLRNNHEKKIYNGMIGTIQKIYSLDDIWFKVEVLMDGEHVPYSGKILKEQFNNIQQNNFSQSRKLAIDGDLFDFGYALTVHKAQGSQANRVILFEERSQHMDDEIWKKWLYTGITRAEEKLYIIGN